MADRDTDTLSKSGAQRLADDLRKFWRDHPRVKFRIVEVGHPRRAGEYLWCVRSNLVNGLPPHA